METLPYFHPETDTGVRFDFMNIVRTLVQRLRGAVAQLSRVLQRVIFQTQHETLEISELRSKHVASEFDLDTQYVMDQHMTFLNWYIRFLSSELQPTASYQRHITALKTLTTFLQSGLDIGVPQGYLTRYAQGDGKWAVNIRVFQPYLLRLLFDLSMDSFDDVREAAVLVLKMNGSGALADLQHGKRSRPLQNLQELSPTRQARSGQSADWFRQERRVGSLDLRIVLSRAQKTLHATGRADHADGVARLYEILSEACVRRTLEASGAALSENWWWSSTSSIVDRILIALEDGLLLAKNNLRLAVASAPIHGHLAALRYRNPALIVLC